MATAQDFTFAPFLITTDRAVNAVQAANACRIRDRHGNLIRVKPGQYVLQDEDGSLRTMPAALFEAEYTVVGTITAPNTLSGSGNTVAAIDLSWTVGDATAVPCIEQGGVEIHQNAANDGTYTVSGLTANTAYVFRVRNLKDEKYSAYLTPLTAYTLPVPIVDAPAASAVTATGLTATWVNADATAKTQIHVDDGAGGAFSVFSTEAAAAVSKAITGLSGNKPYKVKLKHEGAVSTLASATFSATLTEYTLPATITAAPTSGAQGATTINLAWTNVDATAETEIWVDDGAAGPFTLFSTEAAAATSKQITGLTASTTYLIKIRHRGVISDKVSAAYSATLSQATTS